MVPKKVSARTLREACLLWNERGVACICVSPSEEGVDDVPVKPTEGGGVFNQAIFFKMNFKLLVNRESNLITSRAFC